MSLSEQHPTNELIFSLNSEGILTLLHGPAVAATGWQIGQSIHTVGADHDNLLPAVQSAMSGQMAMTSLRFGETVYPVRLIPQPNGHPGRHGVIAFTYDSGYSQLDQLTSRFISMITHRFRNPLTVINTTTFLLERYDAKLDAAKKKEYFDKIRAQVGQLDEMINQVLIVHGKNDHVFSPKPLDLAAVAKNVLDDTQATLGTSHRLTFSITGNLRMTGDAKLLTDMMQHLVINAVKFSPAGGEISLRLTGSAEAAIIEVEDHGLGIPQADQGRIGQPFFRASNAAYLQGSGLGLRIATLYAEQHGGTITFTSQEGQGSTFTIRLPYSVS